MGDKNIEGPGKQQAGENTDTHKNLLADVTYSQFLKDPHAKSENQQLTGIENTTAGRIGMGLLQGFGNSFSAAASDVAFELNHPTDLLKKAATGAAFGAAFRLLLPESGALKAFAGTAMSYLFLKDAAQPIIEGVTDSARATNRAQLNAASDKMGSALGEFYVNGAIAMGSGMVGEGMTGAALRGTALGRSFEGWKTTQFNSDQTALGRMFKGSERLADRTSDRVASSLRISRQEPGDLPLNEKLDGINKAGKHHIVKDGVVNTGEGKPPDTSTIGGQTLSKFDFEGMKQSGQRFRSLSDTIDTLLPPDEPTVKLDPTGTGPNLREMNFRRDASARFNDNTNAGDTAGGDGSSVPEEAARSKNKPTDGTAKPNDATPAKPQETGDMTSGNVGDMAIAMRKATAKVTTDDMRVKQVKEDMQAPLVSTMRSGQAPLDQGHWNNSRKLMALNKQIETVQDVQQAGPLLDHFRVALQQLELTTNGEMPQVKALNQYSRSIVSALMERVVKNGIPIEVFRGTNAPMFGIRDVDGAGPYTIPAVHGVTDAAVVAYPREFDGLQGVHTAGVYAHELGHDSVYGDLLGFPAEQRDKILTEGIVKAAMKQSGIADTEIQVPGAPGGAMKKSDFFVALLKAEANENTADMFGTSIDPNTGLSLGNLLGALRKPAAENPAGFGQLETRSMYGKDLVDADMQNTLGIEPHGIDRWRLKLGAETLRQLGRGDKAVSEFANGLDQLANTMSRPGSQYVWANMDEPGKFVSIPQAEWDAIIPSLVKAQFDTPLDVLKGKTLRDISPDMPKLFANVDTLANQMADAAVQGKDSIAGFDKNNYRIEEVYSAGLSGWMKAVAKAKASGAKINADVLMERINALSDKYTQQYVNDTPETKIPGYSTLINPMDVNASSLGVIGRAGVRAAQYQPHLRDKVADWTPRIGAYAGNKLFGSDLLDTKRVQDQMLNSGDNTGR